MFFSWSKTRVAPFVHSAQHPSIGTTAWQRIRHGEEKEIGMKVFLCKAYSIALHRIVLPFGFYCAAKMNSIMKFWWANSPAPAKSFIVHCFP